MAYRAGNRVKDKKEENFVRINAPQGIAFEPVEVDKKDFSGYAEIFQEQRISPEGTGSCGSRASSTEKTDGVTAFFRVDVQGFPGRAEGDFA